MEITCHGSNVLYLGNTGDGKTTMAISLMVAAFDEDECLLITSPEQWDHVDSRAVSAVLMDDIFGSGSLDEKLLMQWESKFDEVVQMYTFIIRTTLIIKENAATSKQLTRNLVKDIENLAIILVPLIMILSRGHTGQIKGQILLGDYDFLTGGNKVVP